MGAPKLEKEINTSESSASIQSNLKRQENYVDENLMKINHGKWFTVRVVRHWNRLPKEVVDALSLEVFKARLDGALSNLIYKNTQQDRLGTEWLGHTSAEKDLGFLVDTVLNSIWSDVSNFGLTSKRPWYNGDCQRRAAKMIKGLGHMTHKEWPSELGLFSLGTRRQPGRPHYSVQFSNAHSDKTGRNEHSLENGKFQLGEKKNSFSMRVVKHWKRLLRDTTASLSLELFKIPGQSPEQPAL
ncbi:hypothetical protein QYF61_026439, partial [Mycteria americana]